MQQENKQSTSSQRESRRTSSLTEVASPLPRDAKRIYFIRHAQSHGHAPLSPMDPGLTETGLLQLEALQCYFSTKALDLIVSSELERAKRTALALQMVYPDVLLIIDKDLNEVHTIGNWRAYSEEDAYRLRNERMYLPDHACPSGESPRQLYRRVKKAWERIITQKARNIAVVTHYGVLGILLSLLFGATEESEAAFAIVYPHAAISEIWMRDTHEDPALPEQVAVVRSLCSSDHLPPGVITS